jgi:hypothetical protein
MPCPACGASGEAASCAACGHPVVVCGRYLLVEAHGDRTWRALDLEESRWVAASARPGGPSSGPGRLPPDHPSLPGWIEASDGWVVSRWVQPRPVAGGDGGWLEAAVGLLDALDTLHGAGWHHGRIDPAHLARDTDGEIVLLGWPLPGDGAADDLHDLGDLVSHHLATSPSSEAHELVMAFDRGPETVAEVYRQLAEPTWAEPLPVDEPEPFVQWLDTPAARQVRQQRARRRARPLFLVAVAIVAVGWWLRPQPVQWSERLQVPVGLEPIAAELEADHQVRDCLAGSTPGAVAAVVTVERDPTRFRPARYRVDARDPAVARCVLRTAKGVDPGEVPGRWTLVLPLSAPSA